MEFLKRHKGKIIGGLSAAFALAAGLGSTLLTPEQREAIMMFAQTILGLL